MSNKKLREPEARILALQIAASFPGHQATTAEIKECAPNYREMGPDDLKQSLTRVNEHKWEQIMGNVISHQTTLTSIFNRGYAVRITDGIQVTDAGLAMLKEKGLYE